LFKPTAFSALCSAVCFVSGTLKNLQPERVGKENQSNVGDKDNGDDGGGGNDVNDDKGDDDKRMELKTLFTTNNHESRSILKIPLINLQQY
jgi:hypothetical protein